MSASILQLVASGVQNLHIVGKPEITFFKTVYRRHTNFSTESVPLHLPDGTDFGSKTSKNIQLIGDLLYRVYFSATIPSVSLTNDNNKIDKITKFAWVRKLGFTIIKNTSVEIGGDIIDKQYGEWLHIWNELCEKNKDGVDKLIGNVDELIQFSSEKDEYTINVPLKFWFCRNSGLSLPLICLKFHQVKLHIEIEKLSNCCIFGPTNYIKINDGIVRFSEYEYIEQTINSETAKGIFMDFDQDTGNLYYVRIGSQKFQSSDSEDDDEYKIVGLTSKYYTYPKKNTKERIKRKRQISNLSLTNCKFMCEFIYLDNDERKKFLENSHQYLIEQLQFNGEQTLGFPVNKINLSFKHPIKELFWVSQIKDFLTENYYDHMNYTDSYKKINNKPCGNNLITKCNIKVNGISRIDDQDGTYFGWNQAFDNHSACPEEGINIFSFSLLPEDYQPSGSLNASMVEKMCLHIWLNKIINETNPAYLKTYSLSYNILRVSAGLAGVAFY
jgi:hypothetical protein